MLISGNTSSQTHNYQCKIEKLVQCFDCDMRASFIAWQCGFFVVFLLCCFKDDCTLGDEKYLL